MSRPAYLLLPRPGFAPEQLDAWLRGLGLLRITDQPRRRDQLRLLRWRGAAGEAPPEVAYEVEYKEDHILGQRLLYLFGPRAPELAQNFVQRWPCWSPEQALALARAALDVVVQIETLAPVAALIADGAIAVADAQALLLQRLGDAAPVVRHAALLVCDRVAGPELRAALRGAPQLDQALHAKRGGSDAAGTEPASDLASATTAELQPEAPQGDEPTAVVPLPQINEALARDPLASSAYWARAEHSAAAGRTWPALIDVTTALAVARRQGVRLQEMQELQRSLRAELAAAAAPPTAGVELQAVAQLAQLLRLGRLHEVEEIAEFLLTLPGRPPLWWLAIGLARRERGRLTQATAALENALAAAPDFHAARFVLGECRCALGDLEGARQDFARLDPLPAERPPRPTLLDAYADELLGTQAPWQSPEHGLARAQLLRELGRPDEALAVTSAMLTQSSPPADVLLAHGVLLLDLAQPAEALITLERGRAALRPEERLFTEPDPLAILELHRGAALHALARPTEAAVALRAALRLCPELAERAAALTPAGFPAAVPPLTAPPAGYALLRHLAQHALPQADPAWTPEPTATPPPLGAPHQARTAAIDPADAAVAWTAVRGQAGELLVAALAALDAELDAAAAQTLLAQAQRGFAALALLLPPSVAAPADALVQRLLRTTAQALDLADP